jgi:hypothetical protein
MRHEAPSPRAPRPTSPLQLSNPLRGTKRRPRERHNPALTASAFESAPRHEAPSPRAPQPGPHRFSFRIRSAARRVSSREGTRAKRT